MRKVVANSSVAAMIVESIGQLVAKGYFSSPEYAVDYVNDIIDFYQNNLNHLIHWPAPAYFARYGRNLHYAMYTKNGHTTWYAFFETTPEEFIITYIGNNHTIGHLLNIGLA